jgi:hypothetical protein
MAWDKEHIRRLLREVNSTKGQASLQKSQELLDYVTRHEGQDKPAQEPPADATERNPFRPDAG